MANAAPGAYYVPHGTRWPILGSIGLFLTVGGAALWLNEVGAGKFIMVLGIATILSMMFGWFRTVIGESGKQSGRSVRFRRFTDAPVHQALFQARRNPVVQSLPEGCGVDEQAIERDDLRCGGVQEPEL